MGAQKNRLTETVLLSTQNTCLNWWIRKYWQFYAANVCLTGPMKYFYAAGRRRNKLHFHYIFEDSSTSGHYIFEDSSTSADHIQNFHFFIIGKSHFLAPLTCHCKTKFPTLYPMIYLSKWSFWIQLSPKWLLTIAIGYLGESFQDYSWIQDFEADRKSASKSWILQVIIAFLI